MTKTPEKEEGREEIIDTSSLEFPNQEVEPIIEGKNVEKNIKKNKIIFFLNKNKWNVLFVLILFTALVLRWKYVRQESIWNDSAVHLWYAMKVFMDPLFVFSREYLLGDYTIPQTLMAIFYFFTHDILLSGQLMTLLYAAAGIFFIYLLGKELKSPLAGILGAGLLAFNHLAWFYGSRPLADSPLLTTTIILLYCMARLQREKTKKWGIITGLLFIAAMFTKVQAMIFTLALFLYYLIFQRKNMFKEKGYLYSWLIPAGFLLIAQTVGTLIYHTGVLDRVFQLFLDQRGMPFGFEAFKMIQWMFSWYLLAFAALGVILVLFYKEKRYYFPLVFFAFYYLFFEINVDNTQDRYLLPLLGIGITLAVFALDEIYQFCSAFFTKRIAIFIPLVIVSLLAWNYYQIGEALNYNKTFSYTGYQEAGTWIRENVPEDVPVFAGEYRSIRVFSGREYGGPPATANTPSEDYGGTIWNLRSPFRYTEDYEGEVGRRNFEEDVARLAEKSDVFLEVDIWEYAQPKWFWPLTQKSFDYFSSLGFKVIKFIEREVQTSDGLKKVPVIVILKKDKIESGNTENKEIKEEN